MKKNNQWTICSCELQLGELCLCENPHIEANNYADKEEG